MTINTDTVQMTVEIDGVEYEVAPKTVAICEALEAVEKRYEHDQPYKLWLAEIEIILGKDAVKELFQDGRNENIDRIQAIYAGVARAFRYNAEQLETDEISRQTELYTNALSQLNALIKLTGNGKQGALREIRKR